MIQKYESLPPIPKQFKCSACGLKSKHGSIMYYCARKEYISHDDLIGVFEPHIEIACVRCGYRSAYKLVS